MRLGVGEPRGSLKPIRIVVVGEKGTGKSSLIKAAADGFFHSKVPPLLPHTNLPSELSSDPIPATIVDTSSRPKDKGKVIKEVKEADAIVLTFAFDRQETVDRLSEYWLPLFRQLEVRVPIIVAGYKVDVNGVYNQISIEQITTPIMQQYREIETSIEWSAQDLNQARDVFNHAQQAVIHPLGPIYDQETHSLKPRCVAALKRIFRLSSHNRHFILNDAELNDIQVHCFDKPLTHSQCKEIRKSVQVRCPQGATEKGLTLDGFLFLSTDLIEQGRIRTLWTILRKFGYKNDLRLADYMIPYSSFKREADQSVELTDKAIRFLWEVVYELIDKYGVTNLGPHEMGYLFQTSPESPWNEAPYKDAAEITKNGGLSFEAFLSLWSLMTLIDPARSLEYLIYIRYPYDPSSAIHVTRRRELDRKEQNSERKVVQCFVFGPNNAGKSALLNRFIGRSYDEENRNGSAHEEHYAVNMVRVTANTKKTLVMKEIQYREDGFLLSDESLAACDVAIFVYDSSDESSWKRAIDLLAEVAATSKDAGFEFPCLMVAAKTDLDSFPMAIQESTRVAQDIGIEAPIPISSKLRDFDNLFLKILTSAEHPHLGIPAIKSKKKRSFKLINRSLMAISMGSAALIVGLASFRLYAGRKQS
ncbi:hypothetical protein EUTSA_v10020270mg [Eutrema salsugineum]|uniref:Mitochondrial Rho GTPase n=1 Tax=Eutrema salsugineum TaxID=72664 RepID=V4M0E8_EUTSA|nr:mitochondrial Rho GTPase 3 [Eutrema salsugineum]ESQ49544.1 hypothetical protein EUTSA_v10020270mg [Eutrema salsugineum]